VLTSESYLLAWAVYVAATLTGLLIFYVWISSAMSRAAGLTLVLLLAVVALTPARPAADLSTWAPAIIVAAFDLMTDGVEAARQPLRSMLVASALTLGVCLLVYLGGRALGRGKEG
jgi:hypothetical protein